MRIQSSLALLSLDIAMLFSPAVSFAQLDISVDISADSAPPELPVYELPPAPEPSYVWTPGYWSYDEDYGYYWVPGTWVLPPVVGVLWTPGYWGWSGGEYVWNRGYWGPHVGYYGGINYGYGYGGHGYGGGEWSGHSFRYNTAVSNVNSSVVHNTYVNRSVVNSNSGGRASNG